MSVFVCRPRACVVAGTASCDPPEMLQFPGCGFESRPAAFPRRESWKFIFPGGWVTSRAVSAILGL
eukprot:11788031-Alexandrium_andersonii.AAC.1